MVERLRNHGKPLPAEPPWEQILAGQNLNEKDTKNEEEPWSSTFRSSLVSAFNAVAANLSSPAAALQMNNNDGRLTSAPSKRTARKSVKDTFWGDTMLKDKELSRETSVSTMSSKSWTLEETREGAGVVHLFIPNLQKCDDEPVIQRPHLSGPILSFGDGDDFISDGVDDNGRSLVVEHPQVVPLIASEKPPPAVIRADSSYTRRNTRKSIVFDHSSPSLSREESNHYSTASASIGSQTRGNRTFELSLPMVSSRPGSLRIPTNPYYYDDDDDDDSSDSVVIEPCQNSKLSELSSDSSTMSTVIFDGIADTEVIVQDASRALKDRRNRVV
jgi:hypothetical protein